MKKIFQYAMMAVAALAMSCTAISCGDDNEDATVPGSSSSATEKIDTITILNAYIPSDAYEYFDINFTLNGKAVTMTKKSEDSYGIEFEYTERANHKGEKVVATVTVKSSLDCDKVEDLSYSGSTAYYTARITESGRILDAEVIGVLSRSKANLSDVIEYGYATDNKSALEYLGSTLASSLSGTVH